ncbi:hypothetical protein LCGC14_1628160 [marine sediment metagenome]|uniref:Uncharacterized protein n=1 Tax=marine sediment metagenome TaxID=412755 RepID=A0A0F9IQI3_9ZZZZ
MWWPEGPKPDASLAPVHQDLDLGPPFVRNVSPKPLWSTPKRLQVRLFQKRRHKWRLRLPLA